MQYALHEDITTSWVTIRVPEMEVKHLRLKCPHSSNPCLTISCLNLTNNIMEDTCSKENGYHDWKRNNIVWECRKCKIKVEVPNYEKIKTKSR